MNGATSSSVAAESAKKVCTRMHQGYRDRRLYPLGHPTVRNTMEMLMATVKSHLDSLGPLVLLVGEDRLLYEGEEVYTHAESRDNLAFLMFRDGIRVLTLTPGIETREVGALVDSLACADQMVDTDHDLGTALWERDLMHVEVEVVDPFLEGEGARDDSFDELRDTVLRRLNELTSIDKEGTDAKGAVEVGKGATASGGGTEREEQERVDVESVALTEEEIERGEWLVAHPSDPLDDFAVVLLEIVGNPSGLPSGDEEVFRSLSLVIEQYLDVCNLDGLGLVMDRLGLLETEGRLPKGSAERIFGQAATAERLSALIAAAAMSPEKAEGVEQFLAHMRGSVYPAFLEILATSDDKAVRKTVLDLLHKEGGVPVRHLRPLMKDVRWYVVRNAVQLATASGDPGTVGELEPLLRHPDSRVRREVVRSLGTLAEARCLPLLVRALQDEDSAVRVLAVRGLTHQGTKGQFPAVQSQVEARDFEARSPEEVEAFLAAFATLGGDRTIETLNRIWKRRVFGTRSLPLRLAAVKALGAVGSAEARRALSGAADCGDVQLQKMAARVLSEAQAREKGTHP